jgi:diguanylate cyclase (GGDEF)-like protein
MKPLILLVDDVDINLDILKELLKEKYELLCARDGQEAIDVVMSENIDLILLDIMMPKLDGYKVCSILKQQEKTKRIPIIFVTSKVDEESIAKGYDMGAVDYVTKPYKRKELLARIKTHLEIRNLINNLEYIANHDTMTGVYNRRQFFKLATHKFLHNKDTLYAVMIDIDKFKNINDKYGHQTGDMVIKKFANIVKEYINEDSVFGRLGGEEFGLVCNFEKLNQIEKRVEIIRKAIERDNILLDDKSKVKFTISLGFAKANDTHKTIDDLLKDADEALYDAKGSGRNRVMFRKRCK